MKLRIRSVVAGVIVGMNLACLPVAATAITNDQETIAYNQSAADASQVVKGAGQIAAPHSQALGLMALAMIGLIAIGRRI